MNSEDQGFLSKRTLLAIVLTAALLMGWQFYLNKKYPQRNQPLTASTTTTKLEPQKELKESTSDVLNLKESKPVSIENLKEQSTPQSTVQIEGELWSFEISNIGMSVQKVVLKNHKDRSHAPIVMQVEPGYTMMIEEAGKPSRPVIFQKLVKKSDDEIEGTAEFGGKRIVRTIKALPDQYLLVSSVSMQGLTYQDKISFVLNEVVHESKGGSLLNPALDHQSAFILSEGQTTREKVSTDTALSLQRPLVDIVSIDELYFASAFIDRSVIKPSLELTHQQGNKQLSGVIRYSAPENSTLAEIKIETFIGPKSIDLLKKVDDRLVEIVDFGSFGWIANPLLSLLKLLFSFIGNYGWSIIALTIIVRFLVLPFNMMSYRSMKIMAELNPMIQELRKKHAKDPQRMNTELAALFKEKKANPLGGCLPMLLQMPVFFALYRVLGNSIELYQAPFGFWIHDLSLKDPFFILPILMGVSMFIQQKITPTTMDPQQAKVMMVLPVVFSLMMVALPSGLTLYIFVSTVFGILQQKWFMARSAKMIEAVAR